MEVSVVFNIPPFCSLDSFASHLFRVFVHLNTIKKRGLSRDLRSQSSIFCLVSTFDSIFRVLQINHCKAVLQEILVQKFFYRVQKFH